MHPWNIWNVTWKCLSIVPFSFIRPSLYDIHKWVIKVSVDLENQFTDCLNMHRKMELVSNTICMNHDKSTKVSAIWMLYVCTFINHYHHHHNPSRWSNSVKHRKWLICASLVLCHAMLCRFSVSILFFLRPPHFCSLSFKLSIITLIYFILKCNILFSIFLFITKGIIIDIKICHRVLKYHRFEYIFCHHKLFLNFSLFLATLFFTCKCINISTDAIFHRVTEYLYWMTLNSLEENQNEQPFGENVEY